MKTEIQNKLLEIITSAQSTGSDIYEYVQKEAPELAREVVVSAFIDAAGSVAWLSIGFFILAFLAIWSARGFKKSGEHKDPTGYALGFIASVSGCLLFAAHAFGDIKTMAKCKYAPRVIFIQEAKKLVR